MKRTAIVELFIREIAEEMPFILRALPDESVWSAMVAGLVVDEDVDLSGTKKSAKNRPQTPTAADWKEVYGEMRSMINEWPEPEQRPMAMAA